MTDEIAQSRIDRLHAMLAEVDDAERVPLADVGARVAREIEAWTPGELRLVRVSLGAGKTEAAIAHARSTDRPVIIAAPTHDLAGEIEQRIGLPVARRRGVLRVLRPGGEPECVFAERAARLQEAGGSIPSTLCPRCARVADCPARRRDQRRVTVGPHALLASMLDDHEGAPPLVVVDETPDLFETRTITTREIDELRSLFGMRRGPVKADAARVVGAWLDVLDHALADPEHDLGAAAAPLANVISAALAGITRVSGDPLADLRAAVLEHARDDDSLPLRGDPTRIAGPALDAAVRATALSRVVVAAARTEAIHCRGDRIAVHVLSTAARTLVERGGILLDATPPLEALRALRPDLTHASLVVGDGAPIERTILFSSSGYRRAMAPGRLPAWDVVDPMIERALALVGDARRILLATYQPVADALRDGHLAELLGEGAARVEIAHYGALKGLDRWRDVDALVTVGDPWAERGSVGEQACDLGIDPAAHGLALARAELAQAHGRARDASRQTPCAHVHVGALAPLGWTSASTTVVGPRPSGRPRNAAEVTVDELRAFVERAGGVRAGARALGCSHRALGRYLQGRGIPSALAEMLRIAS